MKNNFDDQSTSTNDQDTPYSSNPIDNAVEVVREKLKHIYEKSIPKTKPGGVSVHLQYKNQLLESGLEPYQIQAEWHKYYLSLNDEQKRQVWNEFYASNQNSKPPQQHQPDPYNEAKTAEDIKKNILRQSKKDFSKPKSLLKSLLFGFGIGLFCLFIFLFTFFNERFIAPFITPSRNLSVDSIIVNGSTVSVSPSPVIIIPKINAEIPVIYSVPTIDENSIETGLQNGVVHYPTTAYPGQLGNGAIFGHSAGNIFSPGLYKYAFTLLHYLKDGDTFTINYQSKAYTYEVFSTFIVSPDDTSVLNDIPNHPATFTLITCDPPGLSTNRLIVQADQISPSPSLDAPETDQNFSEKPSTLPSNSPSLWSEIKKYL